MAPLEPEVCSRVLYSYEEPTAPDDIDQKFGGFEFCETEVIEVDVAKPVKRGFWRRQFGTEATGTQRKFDWAFGVIVPVICFAFDPIVFTDRSGGHSTLLGPGHSEMGDHSIFAYILSFISIRTTMAWLLWGDRLKGFNAAVCGVLAAGALAALVIGVILFPFSLVGLIIAIGALGFTPLFTAVIWARNAVRAYRSASAHLGEPVLAHIVGLIALAAVVVPSVINSEITQSLAASVLSSIK